jgi:DtxR family Mn-dependent transcriptional regulator
MNAALASDGLTRSVEDYLKVIYSLSSAGHPASTSDIAHHLDLSPPSVSGMVKRLSEQGLLEHLPYRGVILTDAGRRLALRVVRRHRLIEAYLVQFLGYTWDAVHAEAERLEHAVTDSLVERMAAALGNPSVDPHGDPIPTADGAIAEPSWTPLAEVAVGETVTLRRVSLSDAERLRYLAACGLVPGAEVTLRERQPFDGPLTLEVGGAERVLGWDLGHALFCERAGARGDA